MFTTRCVEKGFGLSVTLDTSDHTWDSFKKAIEIRNRITHPKGYQEFEVSREEADLAVDVGHWFTAFVSDWFGKFISTAEPVYETDNASTSDS